MKELLSQDLVIIMRCILNLVVATFYFKYKISQLLNVFIFVSVPVVGGAAASSNVSLHSAASAGDNSKLDNRQNKKSKWDKVNIFSSIHFFISFLLWIMH
jgi:hypothetical protein